jgi:oligopeptide/dipeptide ABC transporter ATP-binding protein
MSEAALLEVDDLRTSFNVKRAGRSLRVPAVDGVSFSLGRGEVLGIVGESGCGKTTVGRSIMRLAQAQEGRVLFRDTDVLHADGAGLNDLRLNIRMVFQDPYASLNPRRTVGDSIAEAGDINRAFKDREDRARQVATTLASVGLDLSFAKRYPHELSGGQRQRVGIARAILPVPSVIIADEPVSALDVSVQAQVLNLLMDLRERLQLSMIFISHDIGVIGHVSDRIAVMYMGRIVEAAETEALLDAPAHPYTRALLAAVPRPDASVRIRGSVLTDEPPSQFARPAGCAFVPRCPIASERCRTEAPQLRAWSPARDRQVACHNS